jgi:PhnB protein
MSKAWKPKNYNCVSPYLVVANPDRVINFLKMAFGAKALRRHESKDGRVLHAEVMIGDSVIMLGDPGDSISVPSHVHVYVKDVGATFKKALKAGGKVIQKPTKKGDSDKRAGIVDPSRVITWWIGTQIETKRLV